MNERHGPALGVVPEARYGSAGVQLNPGDSIVLYTDGVTEAASPTDELFGADTLLRLLATRSAASPAKLGEGILQAVDQFSGGAEQTDDITLLILQFNAAKAVSAPRSAEVS